MLSGNSLQAQCNSWDGHPKGIEQAKEQHIFYRDLFHSKQYKKAFPIWKELFQSVQSPKEAPSRHFKDGIKCYYAFAKEEKNATKKAAYIDLLIDLYQQQENCLGEKGADKVWLGYHLYALRADPNLAIEAFEAALRLDGNQTAKTVILPLAQLSVYLYQKKHPKFTTEYLTNLYHQLKELAEHNNTPAYLEKWKKAEQEFLRTQKYLTSIWGCDFYEDYWKPLYLKDSNNTDQNKEILTVLARTCAKDRPFYWRVARHQEYLQVMVCHLPRIPSSIHEQGQYQEMRARYFLKNGDTLQYETYRGKAFELYEEAIHKKDSTLTTKETAELAYRIAYEAFREDNFPKARKWCRTASAYQPNWGEPYILVGNLYASSYSKCASNNPHNLDGKIVIWVALDEWHKAKRVDPSVEEKVNKSIHIYQKHLPVYDHIFQKSLDIGASYTVGCWIQQKTKIQVIKE
jgi:tetratricopeptide (TPR) repeat protein